MNAQTSLTDEQEEALEAVGVAMARLAARRWRDLQTAMAEHPDVAGPTGQSPMAHEDRATG